MRLPSPFPGMDPWLQYRWRSVHARIVNVASDQLQEQLGGRIVATIQERSYRDSACDLDDVREWEIEIRDFATGGQLITAVEFVSVVNKTGRSGRRKYRQKQVEVIDADANLVEVDLVRGGRLVTLADVRANEMFQRADYHVSVFRAGQEDRIEIYPISLRDRLPTVRIPLRKADDDITLDLAAALKETYRKGRYGEILDYDVPPDPPLREADAKWAKKLIAAWRKK